MTKLNALPPEFIELQLIPLLDSVSSIRLRLCETRLLRDTQDPREREFRRGWQAPELQDVIWATAHALLGCSFQPSATFWLIRHTPILERLQARMYRAALIDHPRAEAKDALPRLFAIDWSAQCFNLCVYCKRQLSVDLAVRRGEFSYISPLRGRNCCCDICRVGGGHLYAFRDNGDAVPDTNDALPYFRHELDVAACAWREHCGWRDQEDPF